MQQVSGFDIRKLRQEAKSRWLKPGEVLYILANYERFEITPKTPEKPPSGCLFLYNRRIHRYFRNDGHSWRRKKNNKTIAEAHEHLKVNNIDVLNCYYARGDKNPCFQRRIYWMLELTYSHIVLVHYREVPEDKTTSVPVLVFTESCSTPTQNSSDITKTEAQSFHLTSKLTGQHRNSCSAGSAGEVSSQFVAANDETSIAEWVENYNNQQPPEELPKLNMQSSLDYDPYYNIGSEELRSNGIENGLLTTDGIHIEEPLDWFHISELNDSIFDGFICNPNSLTEEATINGSNNLIEMLRNSGTLCFEEQLDTTCFMDPCTKVTENQSFTIRDLSPEWAFSFESTKVMIAGDFLFNSSESWAVSFGGTEVPLEIVQQGVIRCQTPPHNVGKVGVYITDGKGKPCSQVLEFEFRQKADLPASTSKLNQESVRSSEELTLLLKLGHVLLDASILEFESALGFDPLGLGVLERPEGHFDHESTMKCVMEGLLKDKLNQWLSLKDHKNIGEELLPKKYPGIIHLISALGYDWALRPLLSSGLHVDYRDAHGWSALHWAARFGREKMVIALIAAGASARALSDPTSQDPVPKSPATISSEYGYQGISAFLSEAELTSHPLAMEENEISKALVPGEEVIRAVDTMSKKSAHLHGGTEEQLALEDFLEASRNATLAAARIHTAFGIDSFKKKQDKTAEDTDSYGICLHENTELSYAAWSLERSKNAALSIQKNYRCWKKRREYLTLRKHVIKIQAHVRACQERKKYRELLWSVGIIDKLIRRWYHKGVGLRGFHPETPLIDEEDEEDIIKVFRKKNVKVALDKAVSRVSLIIECPEAMQQYRRMLKTYQEAKIDQEG